MQIFFAAPLFNEAERGFNKRVAETFRGEGFDVWLAQEHKFIEKSSMDEKRQIFEEDLQALRESDIVVALLDGVDVDSGVAFEVGYAHAFKKRIVGLKTDHRVFSKIEEVNLMLEVPIVVICRGPEEVLLYLKKKH
jgi:nucleoside 2-deoxyribosyltransferase